MRQNYQDDEQYGETLDYLSGELTEREAEEFEQRYLADPDTFEMLEAIEEDLIEDYLHSALSPERRLLFERRYLIRPENRAKVEFAKRLINCVSSAISQPDLPVVTASPDPRLRYRLADWAHSTAFYIGVSAGVVVLIAGVWLVTAVVRLNDRLATAERIRAELEQKQEELQSLLEAERGNNKPLADELQRVRDQLSAMRQNESGGSVFALFLTPDVTRGASQNQPVRLPPASATLKLTLDVSRLDFATYDATVTQRSGGVISVGTGLKPLRTRRSMVVNVRVLAAGLKSGSYVVVLNGRTPAGESRFAGEYSFKITRE